MQNHKLYLSLIASRWESHLTKNIQAIWLKMI